MRLSLRPASWSALGAIALAACDPGATAIQLVLAPTAGVTTPRLLTEQVESLAVLVDALAGLEGVTSAGPTAGGGVAFDADGDGELEVLFRGPTLEGSALPVLSLALEHNRGRPLEIRVYGLPPGVAHDRLDLAVALGGATASCDAGEIEAVGVPFNLLASARPPHVILVLPSPGAYSVPANLAAVSILFSTTVEEPGALAAAELRGPDGAPVSITARLETVSLSGPSGPEDRSSLTLAPGAKLVGGMHFVHVEPTVVSTRGLPFDQDLSTEAPDPFSSQFDALARIDGPFCACPVGYRCAADGEHCEPEPGCVDRCQPGYVCDPAAGACVADCRVHEACADPSERCDPADGRCAPAPR